MPHRQAEALRVVSRVVRSVVGLVAVLAAVGVTYELVRTKPQAPLADERLSPPVAAVLPAPVVRLPRVWTGYGTARALNAADVAAEVAGRVIERPVAIEDGARVGAGDLIARLDPRDYQGRADALRQQVAGATADLSGLEVEEASLRERVALSQDQAEAARRELERAREVFSRGSGNESAIDARVQSLQQVLVTLEGLREQLARVPSRRSAIEATLAARRADLRVAEADLERTVIKAPLAGVIQRVSVEAGEFVRAGEPVARVVDLSEIEVPIRLPVSASDRLAVGDTATLWADGASPGELSWVGTVRRIAPEADAASRSVTVFVVVRQRDGLGDGEAAGLLRPGRFVLAEVTSQSDEPRVLVPRRVVEADRVRVALPPDPGWLESVEVREDPRLLRVDLSRARRLRRVSEVQIEVERYIEGHFPGIDPVEREWAVLVPGMDAGDDGAGDGAVDGVGLREGDLLIVGNPSAWRLGELVDALLPAERVVGPGGERREGAPAAGAGAEPGASAEAGVGAGASL